MGIRFRKSIKILPGVRLNIGKKSVSMSVGTKGFRHTISSTGRATTTVGIPGTGLSYTETSKYYENKEIEHNQVMLCSIKKKSLALILCMLSGCIGVHRFYVGKTGTGILYLCTFGLFGLGTLVDFFVILFGNFRDAEGRKLSS